MTLNDNSDDLELARALAQGPWATKLQQARWLQEIRQARARSQAEEIARLKAEIAKERAR